MAYYQPVLNSRSIIFILGICYYSLYKIRLLQAKIMMTDSIAVFKIIIGAAFAAIQYQCQIGRASCRERV